MPIKNLPTPVPVFKQKVNRKKNFAKISIIKQIKKNIMFINSFPLLSFMLARPIAKLSNS